MLLKGVSPVCGRIAEGGSDTILLPDASASTWFVVGEGIWEARECSNLDGRGRPSSTEVFLEMADRSVRTASGASLRRTAGGGVPTWFGVAGEEFGGTPALEPGRAGTPVLHRVFFNGGQER